MIKLQNLFLMRVWLIVQKILQDKGIWSQILGDDISEVSNTLLVHQSVIGLSKLRDVAVENLVCWDYFSRVLG